MPAVGILGGVHILLGVIFYNDFGGSDALWHFLGGTLTTATAIALAMLARIAAKDGPASLVERSSEGNAYAEPLRIAIAVAAVAGVLGAVVAWWDWQDHDAWIALHRHD